jgi:hypothetical protein
VSAIGRLLRQDYGIEVSLDTLKLWGDELRHRRPRWVAKAPRALATSSRSGPCVPALAPTPTALDRIRPAMGSRRTDDVVVREATAVTLNALPA